MHESIPDSSLTNVLSVKSHFQGRPMCTGMNAHTLGPNLFSVRYVIRLLPENPIYITMNGFTLGTNLTSVLFVIRLLHKAAISIAMKTPTQDLSLSNAVFAKRLSQGVTI